MRWLQGKPLGRHGQSVLEYSLILLVVILAIVAMANGPIKNAVNQMFTDSATQITNASSKLAAQ